MDTSPSLETPPIWLWDRPAAPIRPAHHGRATADVLVVGAGLAGTAVAYHLAALRPDLDIVLVDAQQVGMGATGRSTGIVGPGVSTSLRGLRRRYGDDVAAASFGSTRAGVAEVRRLVQAERIDCDARLEQHVVAALTRGQESRMLRHTSDLADLGFDVPWWDQGSVARRLGEDYRAAFAYDQVLLVNPYLLVTGLAAAAERLGVRIHERTRVTQLERRTGSVHAHTAGGVIAAGQVVLAIDGYGSGLNPHASSVVPVRTHVVATAPLTEQQRADLGWDGFGGVIDQRAFFSYYRMGAGHRLIFGGGPALYPSGDPCRDAHASAAVYSRVEQELRARFPALRDVPLEARWSGLTGGTLDRLPVVGALPDNPRVHFLGGWCGHGLAMSVDSARRYAGMWADPGIPAGAVPAPGLCAASVPLPWFRGGTGGLPSAAFRSVALPAYLRVMDLQDRTSAALAHLGRAAHDRRGHGTPETAPADLSQTTVTLVTAPAAVTAATAPAVRSLASTTSKETFDGH